MFVYTVIAIVQGQFYQVGSHLVNYGQTKEYQQYRAARDKFITSLLRDESGAAIGTGEFTRYERELFPQPGDSPEVIAQKRVARQVATDGMIKGAGPGYKPANVDSGQPVKVSTPEEASKLPKGTKIALPDGTIGTVP